MNVHRHCSRTIAASCALSLALGPPAAHAGDLNAEVNTMFNNLGAIGNYTAPGAFKGQTLNTYTGGNLYYRAPNRNYQLAAIQWPSAKGGCGGIDVFGGSFSHISAGEFRDMLKNITAALPGVAFNLALKSVSPLLGGVVDQFKSWESWINSRQINSCETATAMVASAAEAVGFDQNRACRKLAVTLGLEVDDAGAAKRCASNSAAVLAAGRASADPNVKAQAPFVGNLTWQALKTVSTLDDPARELVMSIAGTVIYHPPEANRDPEKIPPSITKVADLLYGQSDAAAPGHINVQLLKCNDYADCLIVTRRDDNVHEPLTRKVELLMRSISQNIRTRTPVPNNSTAVGFVNTTSLPVWRMLSVGNTIPNSGLAEVFISNYKDVVAADYAFTFLSQFAGFALAALQKNYLSDAVQKDDARDLRTAVYKFLDLLKAEQTQMYSKLVSVSTVATDLERLERTLRANMSAQVIEMLGYSGRTGQ